MEKHKVYFTVCIPTYNRKEKLKLTLQSLERQSYKDFEVIVVDDGSIDNTKNFISEYIKNTPLNLRYIYKSNGGKHTALNIGIESAGSKYFIILDSDDIFTDNCLQYFFDKTIAIDSNEKFCGIICRCAEIKDDNAILIGEKFPKENWITSYIDFHFGKGLTIHGSRYKDCCECIKTKILKEYKFPELITAKFVPESYIFDQIGLKDDLLAFNEILEIKEYQDKIDEIKTELTRIEEVHQEILKKQRTTSGQQEITKAMERDFKAYASKHTKLENQIEALNAKIESFKLPEYLISIQRGIIIEKVKKEKQEKERKIKEQKAQKKAEKQKSKQEKSE